MIRIGFAPAIESSERPARNNRRDTAVARMDEQMARVVDADTEERARIALQASPVHAIRALEVTREGDQLVVTGRVSTFYYKQLAQEAVLSVVKSLPIVNRVEVEDPR